MFSVSELSLVMGERFQLKKEKCTPKGAQAKLSRVFALDPNQIQSDKRWAASATSMRLATPSLSFTVET